MLSVKLNKRQTGTYRTQFSAAPFEHWAHGPEFRSEQGCKTLHFCAVLSPNGPTAARDFSRLLKAHNGSKPHPAFY